MGETSTYSSASEARQHPNGGPSEHRHRPMQEDIQRNGGEVGNPESCWEPKV